MGMNFACPSCATVMLVPEKLLGSTVECPGCGCLLTTENPAVDIADIRTEEKHTREGQLTASEADRWRKVSAGLRLISIGVHVRLGLFTLLAVVFMSSPSFGLSVALGTADAFWFGLALRLALLGSLGLSGLGDLFALATPTPPQGMRRLAAVTIAITLMVLMVYFAAFCLLLLGALGSALGENLIPRAVLELLALLLALPAGGSCCFWLCGVAGHFRDRRTPSSVFWFLVCAGGNILLFLGSFFLVWRVGAVIDASGHLDRSASRGLGAVAVFLLVLNATYMMFLMVWFAILVGGTRKLLDRKLRLAPGIA
jgi:hypothetical protein